MRTKDLNNNTKNNTREDLFSLIEKTEEEEKKILDIIDLRLKYLFFSIYYNIIHTIQRVIRGFSDDELWNLDVTIAKFVLPRLKRFRKNINGYPGDFKDENEWYDVLDKMIQAFDLIAESGYYLPNDKNYRIIEDGLDLFRKYYSCLWD